MGLNLKNLLDREIVVLDALQDVPDSPWWENENPPADIMAKVYARLKSARGKLVGKISSKAISDFDRLISAKASLDELMEWGDNNLVWLGNRRELESEDDERSFSESISKKQLIPVIQSFKVHASRLRPENDLQNAMGPQAWELQVGQATQDFENYLSRITKRILGRLEKGEYAPRSAMNNRNRPMDTDDEDRELSKVGSKATRDITKILGL